MNKIFTTALLYLSLNQIFAQDVALAPPGGNISSPVTACALTNSETVTIMVSANEIKQQLISIFMPDSKLCLFFDNLPWD